VSSQVSSELEFSISAFPLLVKRARRTSGALHRFGVSTDSKSITSGLDTQFDRDIESVEFGVFHDEWGTLRIGHPGNFALFHQSPHARCTPNGPGAGKKERGAQPDKFTACALLRCWCM
jgi:hypothetical protein